MTQRKLYTLLTFIILLLSIESQAQANYEVLDTLVELDEYDELFLKKEKPIGKNVATNDSINKLQYMLEDRYRYTNDSFTKKFSDHMYLQGGIGVKQYITKGGTQNFTPLMQINFLVGKQFNHYHTLRIGGHYAYGFQKEYNKVFQQGSVSADWLLDWSAFTRGYRPDRKVSVSSVIGMGVDINNFNSVTKAAFEGHIGAAIRFYTGPQGYVELEPYFGIGRDNLRINHGSIAYRPYDMRWGVNLSYVYYLKNNQSKESMDRYFKDNKHPYKTLRAPLFVEYGVGAILNFGEKSVPWSNTWGHISQFSLGKWFSPAIGLKLSYALSQTTWNEQTTGGTGSIRERVGTKQFHTVYSGFMFEAMINPLGFRKNYDWDSSAGFYIVGGGGGYGWLNKYAKTDETLRSTTFSAGIHLWKKVSRDLQVFVEPRYIYHIYHRPYIGVPANKTFADHNLHISAGFTVALRTNRFRPEVSLENYERLIPIKEDSAQRVRDYKALVEARNAEVRHWRIGGGVGLPLAINKYYYEAAYDKFNWTAQLYCTYDFTRLHGLRVGFDYATYDRYNVTLSKDFYDFKVHPVPYSEYYEMNQRNIMGAYAHIAYNLNLVNLFSGYLPDRRWNLDMYAGPAITGNYCLSVGYQVEKFEKKGEVTYTRKQNDEVKIRVGGAIGMNLSFMCNKNFSVYVSPTFYLFKNPDHLEESAGGLQCTQMLNVGVQYHFDKMTKKQKK